MAQSYTFTAGPRTPAALATATGVAPGRFTRIALLAPLENVAGQLIDVPLMRIERQRDAGGPYTGETIAVVPRHARGKVAWPTAMRDVNSWHSDGYAWTITTSPANSRVEYRYSVRDGYCYVYPKTQLTGNNTRSMEEVSGTLSLAGDTVQINTNSSFRLTSTRVPNDPSYYAPVTYICGEPTYTQIATLSEFSLVAPIQGEPDVFISTYSPWDVYLSTTIYSDLENPPLVGSSFFSVDVHRNYVQLPKMKSNGITAGLIKALAPVALNIASKYR